jgi:hypothetical protein
MHTYRNSCKTCGDSYEIQSISRFVVENECTGCYLVRTGGKRMKVEQNVMPAAPPPDDLGAAITVLHSVPAMVIESLDEKGKAERSLEKLRILQVVTPPQIALAAGILEHVKGEWFRLETRRTSITKPLLAVKYSIDEIFSPALSVLKAAEAMLKDKIVSATLAIEAANQQAQFEAQQLLAQGDARGAAMATQNLQPTEAPKGIKIADKWEWRVVDVAQLPRDFMTPDLKKIERHVKAHGASSNIPGVSVTRSLGISAGKK